MNNHAMCPISILSLLHSVTRGLLPCLFVFCFLISLPPGTLQALDFDRDGMDDPIIVRPDQNKDLVWNILSSESDYSQISPIEGGAAFGKIGDHLAPATWLGGENPQIGYVRVTDAGVIQWRILGNSAHATNFGDAGDTAIAGGDFNGNGYADAAILKDDGRYIVRRDAFGGVEGGNLVPSNVTYQFLQRQARNGRAIFVSLTPGGRHYPAVVMTRGANIRSNTLIYFNSNGERARLRLAGGTRGSLSYAAPIESTSTSHLMTVNRMKGNRYQVRIHRLTDGSVVSRSGHRTRGVVLVGDFLGKGSQQFGVRQPGKLMVVDPFDSASQSLTLNTGSGILADGVNVNTFSSTSGLGSVCPNISPVVGGMLWKPSSEHSGFPREGRPGMFFKTGAPGGSCAQVYASNGQQVSQMGHYNAGTSKYGKRYYTGWGCGDKKYASQIASAAKAASGNTQVYVKTSNNLCRGPINPTQRNGAL